MNDDGSNQTLIKDFGAFFYLFEWSDSDWIYIAVNSRPGCFPDDLRRIRPDGSEEEILKNNIAVHGATEGPMGEILYVQAPYCWTPSSQIRVFDPLSGFDSVVQPNDGKAEFWPTYGAVINRVAFHQSDSSAGFNNPTNLYLMDWDGGNKKRLTATTGNEAYFVPDFSLDNRFVVAAHERSGQWQLAIVATDGSSISYLAGGQGVVTDPDWGPPGCEFSPDTPFTFVRDRGKPVSKEVTWDSCGGPGSIVLDLKAVSSAYVYLNEELISDPGNFNPNSSLWTQDIVLKEGVNSLEVELRGRPGARVSIEFEQK